VRDGGLDARGGEHDAVAGLDAEPGSLDGRAGVAGGVAASGDLRPQSAVVDCLEEQASGLAARDDVLVEAQLALGAQDAAELAKCFGLIGNAAEDEAHDCRVELAVREGQVLGEARGDRDRHSGFGGLGRCEGSQRRLRLDGDHLGDRGWVVREVRPVAGSDFEDATGEAAQQALAMVGCAPTVGPGRDARIDPREAWMRRFRDAWD
jgi:hypothetical protein